MRKIEKYDLKVNKWVEIDFKDLKNGDIFRIFDNGKRYVSKKDGNNVWITKGSPHQNEDGIWSVNTVY